MHLFTFQFQMHSQRKHSNYVKKYGSKNFKPKKFGTEMPGKSTSFKCGFKACSQEFSLPLELVQHERDTGHGVHTCPICKKQIKNVYNLQRHVQTIHGSVLHRCTICGAHYNRSDNLKTHMKTHQFPNN